MKKTLTLLTLLCIVVFAQGSKNPKPKKDASESPPPAGKTVFDSIRGPAYNPYGTQGAATSIDDMIRYPSDIYGHKFLYISPTEQEGYAVFDFLGGSTMFGLDNNVITLSGDQLAGLILGYATPALGIALGYAISKEWTKSITKVPDQTDPSKTRNHETSVRTTNPGDYIWLSLSLPLGSAKIYALGDWSTGKTSWSVDDDGDKTKLDNSIIRTEIGLTGKSGSLSYLAFLAFLRTGGSFINKDGDKAIDSTTYSNAFLGFHLGYTALQAQTARVIVGLNNLFGVKFYDEIKKMSDSDNYIYINISPNILGEVVLFENWLAFAGATHDLRFQAGDGDRSDDTSLLFIRHDPGTKTFAGIRYRETNWALEAQITANPFVALGGHNTFANFGGWIYF